MSVRADGEELVLGAARGVARMIGWGLVFLVLPLMLVGGLTAYRERGGVEAEAARRLEESRKRLEEERKAHDARNVVIVPQAKGH